MLKDFFNKKTKLGEKNKNKKTYPTFEPTRVTLTGPCLGLA
jgi:hypothetical protein